MRISSAAASNDVSGSLSDVSNNGSAIETNRSVYVIPIILPLLLLNHDGPAHIPALG